MMFARLGDFSFEANDQIIKTFDQISFKAEKNYANHFILGYGSVIEFLGERQQEINLDILLSSTRGVNAENEFKTLESMYARGAAYSLVIGSTFFGFYNIARLALDVLTVDNRGNILKSKVSLGLLRKRD